MSPVNKVDINASMLALALNEIEYMFTQKTLYPTTEQEQVYWVNNLCSNRWNILHWINGKDQVINSPDNGTSGEVMYGMLVQEKSNPNSYVIFIRGTESAVEWIKDAEAVLVDEAESGSKVEYGFYSLYQSLTINNIALRDWVRQNLLTIDNVQITVSGHSLGSAMSCFTSTFISKDAIAANKDPVKLITFACPKPGDSKWSGFMSNNIASDSVVYNYSRDIVPSMPPFDEYSNPPNICILNPDPAVDIPNNPVSNHLLPAYEALLNPSFIPALKASSPMGVLEGGKITLSSIGNLFKSAWNAIVSFF